MSKENENIKLVPELRFPEFEEDWENESFTEVYSFKITNSLSRNKLNYEEGQVKNIHYGDIHTKFSTLFDITKEDVPYINQDVPLDRIDEENYCLEGDIVIADASEDLDDIGKSLEIVNLNNEKLLSGLHTFLARQIEPKLIIGFGGHLFKSKGIRKQIKREAQGAKVLGISKGRISGINIYYPKEETEQQKIATTLTSLDHLIASENEKLEALQAHKKGLLQQLFPAKGSTVPKLRFGEFSGEWEEKKLGSIAENLSNKRIPITSSKREKGNIPYYGATGIIDYVKDFIFEEDLLLISEDGANLMDRNYPIAFSISGKTWVNNHAHVLKFKNKSTEALVQRFINSRSIEDYLTGQAQPKLNRKNLDRLPIPLPKDLKEEREIASCFISLDELITAQSEKIESLKAHKKGLMQQMFPNLKTRRL